MPRTTLEGSYSQMQPVEKAIKEAEELAREIAPDDICCHDARIPRDKSIRGMTVEERLERIINNLPEAEGMRYEVKSAFVSEYYDHCAAFEDCKVCTDKHISCYHETWGIENVCPGTHKSSL